MVPIAPPACPLTRLVAALVLPAILVDCRPPSPASAGAVARPDAEVVFRAEGALATHYDLRRPAELSGLERQVLAVLAATAQRLGKLAPRTDLGAQRATRDIGRGLLPGGPPPAALVDFALRSHGLVDPPPHLVVAEIPPGSEQELLRSLATRFAKILGQGSFSRVGIAVVRPVAAEGARLIVALLESRVQFRPLPRTLRRAETARLELQGASGFYDLKVVIAEPSGAIVSRPLVHRGSSYVARFVCEHVGLYQVEITGDGPHGSEVLANFPVYCDQAAPLEVRYSLGGGAGRPLAELERDVAERTNAVRRRAGLLALRLNAAVATVARAHSEEMMQRGYVGHVSPVTGSPADRLHRARVVHLVARENVARAYSTAEVVVELMKSPAHRSNILATDVTEIGVGIAVDSSGAAPVMLVTENFIRPGTPYHPATATAEILRTIAATRRAAGLSRVTPDDELNRLAAEYVREVARTGKQQPADQRLAGELRQLGGRFRQVDGIFVRTTAIEALGQAQELKRGSTTHVGVGSNAVAGQISIFVIMAIAR